MLETEQPHVSVILTAYDPDRFGDINEGVESILAGRYTDHDVIVIVDGRQQLAERLRNRWVDQADVTVMSNEKNLGAARSRNSAVERAKGDIVAFFDDDAVADKEWLSELVKCYVKHEAVAAGGKMEPIWLSSKPKFLPEEFYWLIGVTYAGFPDELGEVRNTFASNLSIKQSVFHELGGFQAEIGPKGGSLLQSAETDLCARLSAETGRGVLYNPNARVGHKIYEFRTDPLFLLRRAFWQGVSKRGIQVYSDAALNSETDFLHQLVFRAVPRQLKELFVGNHFKGGTQLTFTLLATICVGIGYLYGLFKFFRA